MMVESTAFTMVANDGGHDGSIDDYIDAGTDGRAIRRQAPIPTAVAMQA